MTDAMHEQEREEVEEKVHRLEQEVARLKRTPGGRLGVVRKRSRHRLAGLPLYDVAIGPDFEKGELRGQARGIFAVGDVAIGVVALGRIAVGLIALGGLSFGLLAAAGGLAVGGLAAGGAAAGGVAVGGAAAGILAIGGAAVGHWAYGGATYEIAP
jgi:hypothetical protein